MVSKTAKLNLTKVVAEAVKLVGKPKPKSRANQGENKRKTC